MIPRTAILAGSGAVVLVLAILIGRAQCAPDHPLPPAIEKKITEHAVNTEIDTAEVHRLAGVAAAAKANEAKAIAAVQSARAAAATEHRRADSLARIAAAPSASPASGAKWHAAYLARTSEAESLSVALASSEASRISADQRADAADSAARIQGRRAARADSLLASIIPIARSREQPCRLAYLLPCPSRKVVTVASIAGTVLVMKTHPRVNLLGLQLKF